MPGNGLIGECAAWTNAEKIEGSVSDHQEPHDAGEGKSEGSAVVGHISQEARLANSLHISDAN